MKSIIISFLSTFNSSTKHKSGLQREKTIIAVSAATAMYISFLLTIFCFEVKILTFFFAYILIVTPLLFASVKYGEEIDSNQTTCKWCLWFWTIYFVGGILSPLIMFR